jgi:putative endopeptidase
MDNATLEKQRLDPIKGELRLIDNISSTTDVQAVSTQMMEYGMDPFFSMYAAPDKKNSKVMIATLTQGGLSLPDKDFQDRDFYLRQDNESIKTRDQYQAHVAKMFVMLGDSPEIAENDARTVMRIETKLAKASFNNVDNIDEIKTYNKMSLEELQAFAPGINWFRLFGSLGHPDVAEVNVRNPSFFKELSSALQDESVADWKTFLRWKLILATSSYLSSDLEKEHFDFYKGKIKGQQEMQSRWKRVIDVAAGRVTIDIFGLDRIVGCRCSNFTEVERHRKRACSRSICCSITRRKCNRRRCRARFKHSARVKGERTRGRRSRCSGSAYLPCPG